MESLTFRSTRRELLRVAPPVPHRAPLHFRPGFLPRAARGSGFTLIEIMVVTVILGIALALVVANLQPDDRQAAQREARALVGTLETLQERAVLGGRVLALSFTERGPIVWERNERGDWQESRRQDLGARGASLTVEALTLGATPADPGARIVFLPEGVGVPFELIVALRGHAATISGDALGNLTLKQVAQ